MIATFNQLTQGSDDEAGLLKNQLNDITQKMERLEERFILEEINSELYAKYTEKYRAEKMAIEQNLENSNSKISNLEECIDKAFYYSSNLPSMWTSANYSVKQKIQFLLFPEGICYSKQKDQYLTTRINSVFASIAYLAQDLRQEKSGIPQLNMDYAALVAGSRIELPTSGL